jgi:hypothetical protein
LLGASQSSWAFGSAKNVAKGLIGKAGARLRGLGKKKRIAEGKGRLNVSADGSKSWEQPPSKGLNGWEGFCGQTAIANLLTTHEGNSAPGEAWGGETMR